MTANIVFSCVRPGSRVVSTRAGFFAVDRLRFAFLEKENRGETAATKHRFA
jgi:hypothetical protein